MNNSPKFIIGIGAAAGGFEALQEFFNCMPKTNELTFIIAQNLAPDFNGMMKELLVQNTTIPIETAKNNMRVETGVIYLIPALCEAQIVDNFFVFNTLHHAAPLTPINTLFESLATHYRHSAIGIILSGSGSDGVAGLSCIARNNGLTITQTPAEATFSDMPKHALATKEINYSLSASEIPDIIMEYTRHPDDFNKHLKQLEPINDIEYEDIFHLLAAEYQINFEVYKIGTLSRRIQRRMQLLGLERIADYAAYLRQNNDALKTLYQYLLKGVTEFFRDKEAFEILATDVIPEIFKRARKNETEIRIWITACSTGEEAYSVAILIKEYADKHRLPFAVKLFASDVFPHFIQKARIGRYSAQEVVAQVPPDYLNKYFIKYSDYYEINPDIKNQILFTTHNLLSDPPFSKLDLICCRNLLTHIKLPKQKRVIDSLRFSLNVGGFLFLGPGEGLAALKLDLITHNQAWKIFKKIKPSEVPSIASVPFQKSFAPDLFCEAPHNNPKGALPLFAYNTILQEVVSAGFIIDTTYTIQHSIGQARDLLMLPEGIPTLVLPKIIIDELKALLIAALYQVKITLAPVVYDHITLSASYGKEHTVKMGVYPICDPNNTLAYYWIRLDPHKIKKKSKTITCCSQKNTSHEELIIALEGELVETKTMLQSALRNMETFNEVLQSNMEEQRSANEELNMLNLQRAQNNGEAIQAQEDMNNLILSAEIYAIMLNAKLEICLFTPPTKKIFNFKEHAIGRPISHFQHNLQFDQLLIKTADVLHSKEAYEIEIISYDHLWYLLKIAPYHPQPSLNVRGVVITLTDITQTKLKYRSGTHAKITEHRS